MASYDVYTPTRNIVYHDYQPHPDDIEMKGWKKDEMMRQAALLRIKTMLQMKGGNSEELAQANLGLYGLGKRRSLQQLLTFARFDLRKGTGTADSLDDQCVNFDYVHYDASIPPTANAFSSPDDLDPQPEFPMRTELIYGAVQNTPAEKLLKDEVNGGHFQRIPLTNSEPSSGSSYFTLIFVLWAFGMFVWYTLFVAKDGNGAFGDGKRKTLKKRSPKTGFSSPTSDKQI